MKASRSGEVMPKAANRPRSATGRDRMTGAGVNCARRRWRFGAMVAVAAVALSVWCITARVRCSFSRPACSRAD